MHTDASCRPLGRIVLMWLVLAVAAHGCGGRSADDSSERPNVVVFLLDAARADHFGCYGYERDTTPNVDALAASGILYETAISEAASTFPSTASLMTGLHPAESELLKTQPIPASYPTLAERAQSAGYRTYAYSENPFVTPTFAFDRGFSEFDAVFPHELFQRVGVEAPQFDTRAHLQTALEWMEEESPQPFFAYFHVLRPHNPYTPPPPVRGRFAPDADAELYGATATLLEIDREERRASAEEQAQIVALYDENLAYGDALLGDLLDGMRARGLYDSAVIAVISDHGEGFGEHGRMLHTSTVFDEMIRVPVVVRLPGGAAPQRISTPIQLRDVGHGLARLFGGGLDAEADGGAIFLPGESQPGGSPVRVTYSWTLPRFGLAAARTDTHKLILDVGEDGCTAEPVSLYDLAADPDEREPLRVADHPATAVLAGGFPGVVGDCTESSRGEPQPLDPVTTERLRALGYLE